MATGSSTARATTTSPAKTPAQLLALAGGALLVLAGLLGFAASFALVTPIGLVDGEDVIGLVPVNAADNVLHVALTLLSLAAALVSRRGTGKDVGL